MADLSRDHLVQDEQKMQRLPLVVVNLVIAEMVQRAHLTSMVVLLLDSSVLILQEELRMLSVQKSLGQKFLGDKLVD